MIIYAITHRENGTTYIGQTILSLERRWKNHIATAKRGSHYHLHRALRKYGPTAFDLSVINHASTVPELDLLECEAISQYRAARVPLYNMTKGGEGYREPRTEEHRKKIAAALEGKTFSKERCDNIAAATKGRVPWNKGKRTGPQSPELIAKRTAPLKGRTLTLEHKRKIADTEKKTKATIRALAESRVCA